jgi:hypothetical protein
VQNNHDDQLNEQDSQLQANAETLVRTIQSKVQPSAIFVSGISRREDESHAVVCWAGNHDIAEICNELEYFAEILDPAGCVLLSAGAQSAGTLDGDQRRRALRSNPPPIGGSFSGSQLSGGGLSETGSITCYIKKPDELSCSGILTMSHVAVPAAKLGDKARLQQYRGCHPSWSADYGLLDLDDIGWVGEFTRIHLKGKGFQTADAAVVWLNQQVRKATELKNFDPARVTRTVLVTEIEFDPKHVAVEARLPNDGALVEMALTKSPKSWLKKHLGPGCHVNYVEIEAMEPKGNLFREIQKYPRDGGGFVVVMRIKEELGLLTSTRDPFLKLLGERVYKLGRSTGYTHGIVVGVHCFISGLPYGQEGFGRFSGAIAVLSEGSKPFASPGDSGGLVWMGRGGDLTALGMILGGFRLQNNRMVTLVLPIGPALRSLEVEMCLAAESASC